MAAIFVDLDEVYNPKSEDQPITVRVEIGDGQLGAYLIFLDRTMKGANKKTVVGTGAEVRGKRTLISTVVADVMEETNWTSVTVFFDEGSATTRFGPYAKMAPGHKDTVIFSLNVVHP